MRPSRVLHVVHRMDRGGVETWLMQVLRASEAANFQMDFLVHSSHPGHYDDDIRALGARLFRASSPRTPAAFARDMRRVLINEGPYDAVHSHVHHFSGFVLLIAALAHVPIRIAHSHNSESTPHDRAAGLVRRGYLRAMQAALHRFATVGLAVSDLAAEALFGSAWRGDPRWRILRCGVDFARFKTPSSGCPLREELGLSATTPIVGHVGRFAAQKNHTFLVEIAAETCRRMPDVHFVLVGDGPLRAKTEAQVQRLGLAEHVSFCGIRSDIPRVLAGFDALLFPSLHEGLPLVGLEAQAAGLPIVLSDTITRELAVVEELFTWRALTDPAHAWADSTIAALGPRRITRDDALQRLLASDFNIVRAVPELEAVYQGTKSRP